VAAKVEVLQIEGVVVDLVDGISVEGIGADLEFNDVDGRAVHQDHVGSLTHARDRKFQE